MAFTLPPLPYAYDALEPAIDKETMTFHHDKHHQTYVDNLNKAIDADCQICRASRWKKSSPASRPPPRPCATTAAVTGTTACSGNCWPPPIRPANPRPSSKAAIDADLGGMDKFKEDFNAAGAAQFGSGWAWLIVQNGKLKITSTPNQDNPLMDVVDERGEVILGADVWEHAYYLKYQNRRADYLKSFWTVVNWNKVNELYAAAK